MKTLFILLVYFIGVKISAKCLDTQKWNDSMKADNTSELGSDILRVLASLFWPMILIGYIGLKGFLWFVKSFK